MQKTIHVVPKNGNWAIKTRNSTRVSKITITLKEVVQQATNQAKRDCSGLTTHHKNGKICENKSYVKTISLKKVN